MATVTGLTAERMRQIEAGSIVDGKIDASGHLILTRYDETEIDAGDAVVAVPADAVVQHLDPTGYTNATPATSYPKGVSLLYLTDVQVASGGWGFTGSGGVVHTIHEGPTGNVVQTWQRIGDSTVIPEIWIRGGNGVGWQPWKKVATTEYVDAKLAVVNGKLPGDSITTYPSGLSMSTMAGSTGPTWASIPPTQLGTIITANGGTSRSFQLMQVEDGYLHFRRYREDVGGWRPWQKVLTEQRLAAVDYNQAKIFTGYPWGLSYLYLSATESTAGTWSFSGKFGLVTTFRYSDDFAVQTWQKHQGGSGGQTELWQRTANTASGWSPWRVIASDQLDDTGWINLTPASGFTSAPSASQYTAACRRIGKLVRFRGVLSGTINVNTTATIANMPAGVPFPLKGTNLNALATTGGFIGWTNIMETGAITAHFKTPWVSGSAIMDLNGLSYVID